MKMNKFYPCLILDLQDEILTLHTSESRFVTVCKGDIDTMDYLFSDWQQNLNIHGYEIDVLGNLVRPLFPKR